MYCLSHMTKEKIRTRISFFKSLKRLMEDHDVKSIDVYTGNGCSSDIELEFMFDDQQLDIETLCLDNDEIESVITRLEAKL